MKIHLYIGQRTSILHQLSVEVHACPIESRKISVGVVVKHVVEYRRRPPKDRLSTGSTSMSQHGSLLARDIVDGGGRSRLGDKRKTR